MAETQPPKSDNKRDRQPISIPFLWEEKPGTPKKDWKPIAPLLKPCPPPLKLIVSVPFGWEEKPGTPLPSFVQPPKYPEHSYKNGSGSSNDNQCENEGNGLSSDSDSDTCSYKTSDSFGSAQSLVANGLISTTALSTAIPVQQTSLAVTNAKSGQVESPDSPGSETESCASSYATGTASLVGASFLEWLFPLLAPNSNSPDKVGYLEKEADVQDKELLHERNCSQIRRPLLTLGELIVMSRRRSCQRKVQKMQKQPSMDFMKRNGWGCFTFGSGNGMAGLQIKLKRQLYTFVTF